MARTIAIGAQDFEKIRRNGSFLVDKTLFIREWWENQDDVTLITRPRRFGKTLTMSMVDCFFNVERAGRKLADGGNIFEGLKIWEDEEYRQLQGTYPVIALSFANVKDNTYENARKKIYSIITALYDDKRYILKEDIFSENEKSYYASVNINMDETTATNSLHMLSKFMSRYYGKNVIILLDEYDTPMQEAYISGYWNEAVGFFRSMFNATFKTNPHMDRAIITGITRVSKESIFSDINNLEVVTVSSEKYATSFGFTEDEVFAVMDEFCMDSKDEMKRWYDGFTFGKVSDIYNPWSVTNALDKRQYKPYWANSSSNHLMDTLIKRGNAGLKMQFEELVRGNSIKSYVIDEIVYNQLDDNPEAIWSFMLAAGYLKAVKIEYVGKFNRGLYTLALPNLEVESMVNELVGGWFKTDKVEASYNGFIEALLCDNVKRMNTFMNKVALNTFSYFDTGNKPSEESKPERFYHGFVLGLMVELEDEYEIKSNRESGFGRYDVMLKPFDKTKKAFIFEFKVKDKDDDETTLEDTVRNALTQIEEKQYEQELIQTGIPKENIRKYGFAFEGKTVLIGGI
jgi:hypothetical protein